MSDTDNTQQAPETTGVEVNGLTAGLASQPDDEGDAGNKQTFTPPEGIDPALFDAETGNLKTDEVIKALTQANEAKTSAEKQALDMRRKLSKGVNVPTDAADYAKDYKVAEKYAQFFSDEQKDTPVGKFARESMDVIDKKCHECAMSTQQAAEMKNLFHEFLEQVNIFDIKTEDEKKAERQAWVSEQKKMLGENADEIIKRNVAHYQNDNMFTPEERKVILSLLDQGYEGVSIFDKMRRAIHGTALGDDIPVQTNFTGLADDNSLLAEYKDPKTSDARKEQIIRQRLAAGRPVKFA